MVNNTLFSVYSFFVCAFFVSGNTERKEDTNMFVDRVNSESFVDAFSFMNRLSENNPNDDE